MKVLDLYAGKEGWSKPFRARGHAVWSIDWDEKFDVDVHMDIRELTPKMLPFRPDIILASPPCESFSVGSFRHHWKATADCVNCGYRIIRVSGEKWEHIDYYSQQTCSKPHTRLAPDVTPKSDGGRMGQALMRKTLEIIEKVKPAFFVIENPMALMRKMPDMAHLERRTVTYCRYGKHYRKPTDLWGGFPPSLELHPPCSAVRGEVVIHKGVEYRVDRITGKPCHEKAERGSKMGVQGLSTADAGEIPYELALDVCRAVERDLR